ncbi:MAG: HEAT repeat domain-containing protein [Chloroflexi bacterium]|nr:MAG: HEAT repeat domain-containing protein [Chloroflexota bacterium]
MNRYPPAVFGGDSDSPLQMPQVCGAVAFGEWAAAFQHIEAGVSALLHLADSPLWRVREAAAMGLQRLLARQWDSTIRRLQRRALDASPYEWRAIVAGIAEPDLLSTTARALAAFDLHYGALAYLRRVSAEARRSDAVRTLRQALGYSVSVVTMAAPEAGFALMRAWAAWNDADIRWILRENLKKKRLERWPDDMTALKELID